MVACAMSLILVRDISLVEVVWNLNLLTYQSQVIDGLVHRPSLRDLALASRGRPC